MLAETQQHYCSPLIGESGKLPEHRASRRVFWTTMRPSVPGRASGEVGGLRRGARSIPHEVRRRIDACENPREWNTCGICISYCSRCCTLSRNFYHASSGADPRVHQHSNELKFSSMLSSTVRRLYTTTMVPPHLNFHSHTSLAEPAFINRAPRNRGGTILLEEAP